ncbi:hypothetical protein SEA_TINABELCHER_72 [Streptomyces phage TinaBelcher]|uniref:Uncharacterized protein n=1 Tax=Streptomyces phage Thestral TaxID=2301715 RepID=A0A385E3J3_9CAUD|nr:hypothetical protein KGG90_gp12 [Streptomyces phage Thestral]AXQ62397.1 hypothetical protein SEA_TRVXSCOTT_71 [Streptomyces phage TrvxScott]AXQ65269.1 hypothetical protein SEA_THESTRAL_74 [Streptomyces phage Thestral]QAY15730.1 hypothetical protein SEA_BOWDEN_72 [Streptomyces phage Bowden]QAY15895.1 hypothetical protein SEA_TINABELCHER_72 [Streptomyces phage TinaBelcher]
MTYTVRWTEVSTHERVLSDEEFAELKGLTVAELADLDEDELSEELEDLLAELDDDGFEGLTREIDELQKH